MPQLSYFQAFLNGEEAIEHARIKSGELQVKLGVIRRGKTFYVDSTVPVTKGDILMALFNNGETIIRSKLSYYDGMYFWPEEIDTKQDYKNKFATIQEAIEDAKQKSFALKTILVIVYRWKSFYVENHYKQNWNSKVIGHFLDGRADKTYQYMQTKMEEINRPFNPEEFELFEYMDNYIFRYWLLMFLRFSLFSEDETDRDFPGRAHLLDLLDFFEYHEWFEECDDLKWILDKYDNTFPQKKNESHFDSAFRQLLETGVAM